MVSELNDILYHALASEEIDTRKNAEGTCSLCLRCTNVIDMALVVSRSFTEWEEFTPPYQLCQSCAWVLSDKKLRLHTFLITGQAVTIDPCPHIVTTQKELEDVSLVVPASKQKQLAYHARRGFITTDYGNTALTERYLEVVTDIMYLRSCGMNESALDSVDSPYALSPKMIASVSDKTKFFSLINKCSKLKDATPEIYASCILVSRSTFCTDACPPRG